MRLSRTLDRGCTASPMVGTSGRVKQGTPWQTGGRTRRCFRAREGMFPSSPTCSSMSIGLLRRRHPAHTVLPILHPWTSARTTLRLVRSIAGSAPATPYGYRPDDTSAYNQGGVHGSYGSDYYSASAYNSQPDAQYYPSEDVGELYSGQGTGAVPSPGRARGSRASPAGWSRRRAAAWWGSAAQGRPWRGHEARWERRHKWEGPGEIKGLSSQAGGQPNVARWKSPPLHGCRRVRNTIPLERWR